MIFFVLILSVFPVRKCLEDLLQIFIVLQPSWSLSWTVLSIMMTSAWKKMSNAPLS